MNKYSKETLWFCVPIILSAVLCCIWFKSIFSLNPYIDLSDGISMSVNTYCFIAAITTVLGFIIFLLRNLYNRFRNITTATILLFYTALFILVSTYIIYLNKMLAPQSGWAIYPPLSALKEKIEVEESYFICNPVYLVLFQLSLILFAVFTAFKIGRYYNSVKSIDKQADIPQ